MTGPADIVIDAVTPLGFRVVVVRSAWDVIIDFKHPDMRGREFDIAATLSEPDQVRFSVSSQRTLLFYRSTGRGTWIVAVARRDGEDGYLVTCYESDNIKSGDVTWPR
ncbi:MAG: DUF4258 domain-containing protein [Chloroflexi bacterium]|nr:DUF4258 domain-containing protein [Chloroflexota bacterium]NJD66120.1 DUF4258 domain-containing protein [Chloroflexota bacterium]PWB45663.1 MAG: hypothetical protein C3F10_05040 [Dehalococcoidia bacterium]